MGELQPGSVLDERYAVEGSLGVGGMGVVLRAHDEKLGRHVAIKVLPVSGVGDAAARARLIREARAAAQLQHPGIVQVFDVAESSDGGAYIVMELVRGQSVRQLMRAGSVDRETTVQIVREAAAALGSAHRAGLVHRDVKPDNVMVRDDGRVVVLDFGLVKSFATPLTDSKTPDTPTLEALTRSGAIVGTPAYLAPEQARGRAAQATDQWALAVTAYELLTDRLPWEGDDSTYILAQVLMDDPIAASSVSDVPSAVDAVLGRALSKDPEDRYASIEDFAEALTDALGTEALRTEASPPHATETASAQFAATVGSVRSSADLDAPGSTRWARWVVGAVLCAGLAGAGWFITSVDPSADPGSASDGADSAPGLTEAPAVFACPIFEAEGVDEPSAWLGAAAAASVCVRVEILVGGGSTEVLTPPELLDLPVLPTADFPDDPYSREGARAQTLDAAAERADAWCDGRVRRLDNGTWELELSVESAEGTVARVRVTGEAVYLAAEAAVRELIHVGAWPAAERLTPSLRARTLLEDPEHLLLIESNLDVLFTGVNARAFCERAIAELPGVHPALVDADCGAFVDRPELTVEIDRSSPSALALTALAFVDRTPGADAGGLADEIAAAREAVTDPELSAELVLFEGLLRLFGGDVSAAKPLLRRAIELLPRSWTARVFSVRAEADAEARRALMTTMPAWRPDFAEAWKWTFPDRAYALAPRIPAYGIQHANALMRAERVEETRSVAARLRLNRETELAGRLIEALVDRRRGHFLTSLAGLRAALDAATRPFGVAVNGDVETVETLLFMGDFLGRSAEVADEVVSRFLLTESPQVSSAESFYEAALVLACARATPEIADAGFEALERLRAGHTSGRNRNPEIEGLIAGARAHAHGHMRAAVAAWRPLISSGSLGGRLPAGAFDLGGAPELGRHLDRGRLENAAYGGANPANVREANRCADEGNAACVREQASRAVQAWSTADVALPAVDEMRALLARFPEESP